MKTEISRDGKLSIEPENDLESYALKKWYGEWGSESVLHLIINGKEAEIKPTKEK